MSDSSRPHGLQPTRLLRPWDFPGKSTGVGCHCLLQVVSNSLQFHGLQHARIPCPSPSPGACSNSCPSSRWCHPTISSSVNSFSSYPQSFPASGSFPMSQLFTSGGQSIGDSNDYPGLISFRTDCFDHLAVPGTLKSLPQHHKLKASVLQCSAFFVVQLSRLYLVLEKL